VVLRCGGGDYCPDNPLTRRQMAIFLSKPLASTGTATREIPLENAARPAVEAGRLVSGRASG